MQEARDLLGMLKAATTQYTLDDETVGFWQDSFRPLDAELATKAVLKGRQVWKKFPTWADFWEIYSSLRRNEEMEARREENEARNERITTEGKHGYATPEWVWIWTWARFYRNPREQRSFPQQADFGDPFNAMTLEDYETLRSEWIAAGSPKENPLNLMNGISEMSKKMAEEVA